MANRWGISLEVEDLVRKRDIKCVYCGIDFTNSVLSYRTRPTWEHIINDLTIKGPENIALCCGSCNSSKGKKLLTDWLKSKYCGAKGITKETVAAVVQKHLNGIET